MISLKIKKKKYTKILLLNKFIYLISFNIIDFI